MKVKLITINKKVENIDIDLEMTVETLKGVIYSSLCESLRPEIMSLEIGGKEL